MTERKDSYIFYQDMKKQDTLTHIRNTKGYVPYVQLFDIFTDEDEVPRPLIEMSCMKDEPRGSFIICSPRLADEFTKNKHQTK